MSEQIRNILESIADLREKLYAMSHFPLASDELLTLSRELDSLVLMYHKALDAETDKQPSVPDSANGRLPRRN